ncbi:MAG TPA: pyridoxal-phosphate dependent enzyme [Puia sp.]|nr:pyridoxal-phosphate dependent enzyme [Puia sp.]
MTTLPAHDPSLLQPIILLEGAQDNITADVLRLDRLHPVISGNKWFKLKYYLQQAQRSAANPIITFGGAWSNHLIATAFAAREARLDAVGIVRGEKPPTLSATLSSALHYGMKLEFISRRAYTEKSSAYFLGQLSLRYPGSYMIPEGGAGPLGIRGSEEILRITDTSRYTHILCAIGTGTMFQGLIRASMPGQSVIGVPVLKGVDPLAGIDPSILPPDQSGRAQVLHGYHFGGYARHPPELIDFMNEFYRETAIPSDIVYTGRLFYALRDTIRRNFFPVSSRILVIHSGGLQGNGSLKPGLLEF